MQVLDRLGIGFRKDFAVATLLTSCLLRMELWEWSVSSLKTTDIAFFPVDSTYSCNLLLAVKTKAASCRCVFDKSFLNIVAFLTLLIEKASITSWEGMQE